MCLGALYDYEETVGANMDAYHSDVLPTSNFRCVYQPSLSLILSFTVEYQATSSAIVLDT